METICGEVLFLITTVVLSITTHAYSLILEEQPKFEIGCHKRLYHYRVTQSDDKGRKCWDNVQVVICRGMCESSEIADWKFPYTRKFNPVCIHASRQTTIFFLQNCDPGAGEEAKRFHFVEPESCHCQECSSKDTSCEATGDILGVNAERGELILELSGVDSNSLGES